MIDKKEKKNALLLSYFFSTNMGSVLDFSVNYGCLAYRWCGAGPPSVGGWWRTVRPPRPYAAAPAPIATRKYPTSRSPVNSGRDVEQMRTGRKEQQTFTYLYMCVVVPPWS